MLIWAGVSLAPVAALVVLLGGGDTSVRFAVLLVAVCVVLIGAALLVRNDPVLLRMDVEDQVEALREELREEITASAHATGHRVKALQDEMTRMRAAGSPAMALPPAGGRPAVATASVAPAAGHPPVTRTAASAPVTGSASVGSASVGSASVGSASVGSASVGSASVGSAAGFGAAGSAAVAAAGVPRQRGPAVVPAASGGHQGGYGTGMPEPAARAGSDYGPGLSGSAWAERSAAVEYGSPGANGDFGAADGGLPAEPRPSRRHAAPDTGTDLARFGLGPAAAPAGERYGAEYGIQDGYDQTGDASWTGHSGYSDGYAGPAEQDQPATAGYDGDVSGFFAQDRTSDFVPGNGYPQPSDRGQAAAYEDAQGATYGRQNGYGQAAASYQQADGYAGQDAGYDQDYDEGTGYDQGTGHGRAAGVYGRADTRPGQYGPDPTAADHGWAPRGQEQPGRW